MSNDDDSEESEEWQERFEQEQVAYHNKYLAVVDMFVPDEDDMILFKDDPKWQRLIFPSYEGYRDMENEKYEEFLEHLENEDITVPEWVTKRMLLRVLEGEEFKMKQSGEKFVAHLEWRKKTLPIEFTDERKKFIIDMGLYYVFGRDRSLRPITVFQPIVVVGKKIDLEESLMACHYVAQYVIEEMMVVGKVENWVNILDMAKLGVTSLPTGWIKAFIKSFSESLYARTRVMYLLNCSTAVSIVWGVVKVFVHWTVK